MSKKNSTKQKDEMKRLADSLRVALQRCIDNKLHKILTLQKRGESIIALAEQPDMTFDEFNEKLMQFMKELSRNNDGQSMEGQQ